MKRKRTKTTHLLQQKYKNNKTQVLMKKVLLFLFSGTILVSGTILISGTILVFGTILVSGTISKQMS